MDRVRVLVVDDSAVVRSVLTERLSKLEGIEVVGAAVDPYHARDIIARLGADVLVLDIEMPRMDGLTFLKHLMRHHPIPTIILSSLVDGRNEASLAALDLGAIRVFAKPGGPYSVGELVGDLAEAIRYAPHIDVRKLGRGALAAGRDRAGLRPAARGGMLGSIKATKSLIAVGASTGGTIAMERLFSGFARDFPPTAAVIHMPERFTASFAARLDSICEVDVREAVDGEEALYGTVYIAPGNKHLLVRASGARYVLSVRDGPRVQNQRPSVEVLFESVAEHVGKNALGVIMTGMGRDGAEGLLKMRQAGAHTIAQDEDSCIVYGMPKAAVDIGAAAEILPLDGIAEALRKRLL
jgi:two-component system chemotaxis response regulator CheB